MGNFEKGAYFGAMTATCAYGAFQDWLGYDGYVNWLGHHWVVLPWWVWPIAWVPCAVLAFIGRDR